ncbi:hypothetical protein ABTN50_19275, partial [Acinetobacter baumannii]
EVKRQTLAEKEADLARIAERADQISKNVQDLSELIGNLDKEIANRTGLGAYEQEVANQPPAPPPGPQAALPPPAQTAPGKAAPAALPKDA